MRQPSDIDLSIPSQTGSQDGAKRGRFWPLLQGDSIVC